MTDDRGAYGYFSKGNKLASGRPKGARNKPRAYPFMDERDLSAPARRFRALLVRMADDLGGVGVLTEGQQQLVKRCAMISVACELMEKEVIAGQPLNPAYANFTGHLMRTLSALGLKREPIDVTPPALNEYLDTLQAPAETAETQDLVAAADEDEG